MYGDGKLISPSCAHAQATAFRTSKRPCTKNTNKYFSRVDMFHIQSYAMQSIHARIVEQDELLESSQVNSLSHSEVVAPLS